ncbi:MAG: exonuclease domain-containing protein [Chloroflexota bacterium]
MEGTAGPGPEEGSYNSLAARAYAYLAEAGGRAEEADLCCELFGPTARGPLWTKLLGSVLGGDDRFERSPEGRWALRGLGLADLPLGDVDFVVLDLETTGLKPWRQHVVEVAALRVHNGTVVDAFASLVNPARRVPAYLREVTGITEADLAEAPPFGAVVAELLAFLGQAVLVGYGLRLSIAHLQHELHLLGRPPLDNTVVDTLDFAPWLLPEGTKPTLENLATAAGLRVTRRHRALPDARVVADLFRHMLDLARAKGLRTLADLQAEAEAGRPGSGYYPLLDGSVLGEVPTCPGVYTLRGWAGEVVYVGKAVSLRERLATYFSRSPGYVRNMGGLLETVAGFEVVPLGSELEALLVEARLIAEHRPAYNVQLQAKRQPAFIRIDPQEDYPRLTACDEPLADAAIYYGPLANGRKVRDALRELTALFPLRTCRRKIGLPAGRRRKVPPPCARLRRGLCLGPCAGGEDREQYRGLARQLVAFLGGDRREVVGRLQAEVAAAAALGERARVAEVQRLLRSAHLFSLPMAERWPAGPRSSFAVVQPSVEEGACEVFVVSEGRFAGQVRVALDETDVVMLATRLRSMAGMPNRDPGGEVHIVARWLRLHPEAPTVTLPTANEGWDLAAGQALSLARTLGEGLCYTCSREGSRGEDAPD